MPAVAGVGGPTRAAAALTMGSARRSRGDRTIPRATVEPATDQGGDEPGALRPSPDEVARPLVERLLGDIGRRDAARFVGVDGRSGAGKSTLAVAVVDALGQRAGIVVTVIEGDQFYAGGSAASWDARSAEEKAARVIDWRAQRAVLLELREAGVAEWRPFDWDADDWDADEVPRSADAVRSAVAPVVVLEGAYSCRPELHDLLDLRVLLDTPRDLRRRQLLEREGDEYRSDWEARWSSAEDHYFGHVMPPSRFDLVIGGG